MTNRQMHLVAVLTTGPDLGSWLHPESENDYLNNEWWGRLGQTLESAKFDAIFFADVQTFFSDEMIRKGGDMYLLDPVPLAAAVAAKTEKLGIGITISTSLVEPYAIARSMRSLDVLSKGRMAWNVVTSGNDKEAQAYGSDHLLPKTERYDRADETVDACMQLWDTFPSEAYRVDRHNGEFLDPTKLGTANYVGKYVKTQGTLTVPPSPQGRPMIMQAGSSPRGREFAARWAEIIFTYQRTAAGMQAFRADMNRRLSEVGRTPESCAILPSIQVVVGETSEIARAKRDYLYSLVDDDVALSRASAYVLMDFTAMSPDTKIADINRSAVEAGGSPDVFFSTMENEDLTILEASRKFAFNDLGPELVGTPEEVADQLEEMFTTWGCDGFILNPAVVPGTFEEFARSVVPILQERGLYRSDYSGSTLRSHLTQNQG